MSLGPVAALAILVRNPAASPRVLNRALLLDAEKLKRAAVVYSVLTEEDVSLDELLALRVSDVMKRDAYRMLFGEVKTRPLAADDDDSNVVLELIEQFNQGNVPQSSDLLTLSNDTPRSNKLLTFLNVVRLLELSGRDLAVAGTFFELVKHLPLYVFGELMFYYVDFVHSQ